jgi:predicted O-linked N-acetylglucosamine transferase (SPINDLY family)
MTLDLLRAAAAHFTAGRLAEAAQFSQLALATDPRSRDALRILATVHAHRGEAEAAAALFGKLVQQDPRDAESLHNLGILLIQLGRSAEAASHLEKALRARKNWPDAHATLARALRQLDRLAEAAGQLEKAIRLRPGVFAFHTELGLIRLSLGRPAAAVDHLRKATELAPDRAEAHINLGSALRQAGRRAEAAECFREATLRNPGLIEARISLADTLLELARFDEAAACYRLVLAIAPADTEALTQHGSGLLASGHAESSERMFSRAIASRADSANAHANLGLLHLDRRRLHAATTMLHRAAALAPAHREALNNLGLATQARGGLEAALPLFRRVLHIDPGHALAHSNIIFLFDHLYGADFEQHQAERRRWFLRHGRPHAASISPHANDPDPDRPLRIGYVSADFRQHSAASLFGPILSRIDRTRFRTVCYSGVTVEDDRTRAFRSVSGAWRTTIGLGADDLAAQIRADAIDILVDLSGHSAGHRLEVFARKPAPVQVTAWGYGTGTGLPTIDYFFADPVLVPAEMRSLFAETIYDLPCFIPFEPYADAPPVAAARRSDDAIVFGCFNRRIKIVPQVLALWSRILAALPAAQLLLKDTAFDDPDLARGMMASLGDHGVDRSRVELLGRTDRTAHLAAMSRVDIALDTFPQNGGLTTYESILMGVPVVALLGRSAPGRSSAAILSALGLADWAGEHEEAYVGIATAAATDRERLAALRRSLRQRLLASAAGDLDRYTRAAEAAFRDIWWRWCASRSTGRRDRRT